MKEFIELLFSPANAIPTGLLVFVVLYWIVVIFGMIGTDFLDFDIDADADLDLDADGGTDGMTSSDVSWLNHVLIFFNLGKIPFMVWLSFLVLPLWIGCMITNDLFGISNFFLGLITFAASLFGSLFIAKVATIPFVKMFAVLDKDNKKKDILGRIGTVTLAATDTSKGQAEVNYDGVFLNFYILMKKENTSAPKASKVEFIKATADPNTYWVEPYFEIV